MKTQNMTIYTFRPGSEIGSLDAEADAFLSECFIESTPYTTLLNFDAESQDFKKRIILGRTGSGKSALLLQAIKDGSIKKNDVVEAESTVFEHITNNVFISELIQAGIDLRVFYKSLWLHVLIVKIIEITYTDKNSFFDRILEFSRKPYYKEMSEYVADYRDSFFEDNIIKEITNRVSDGISLEAGINSALKVSGTSNTSNIEKVQSTTARYVSSNLLSKQKSIIKFLIEESDRKVKSLITVDDLDKSWLSSSHIRYDFINALLEAFKELLAIENVKILISVRTDIIAGIYRNSLRQEEKDRSLIIPISWKKIEIEEILDKRINSLIRRQYQSNHDVSFSELFSFKIHDEVAYEYILNRTMLRPRDAIDFVNICLSICDVTTNLNENIVIEAEEKFYSSRKRAMCDEWLSLYESIETYIDALSKVKDKIFTALSLKGLSENILDFVIDNTSVNSDTHTNIATNIDNLIKVWFEIGIIGIEKNKDIVIYSSFDKPDLDITDLEKTFRIHPLFYRY